MSTPIHPLAVQKRWPWYVREPLTFIAFCTYVPLKACLMFFVLFIAGITAKIYQNYTNPSRPMTKKIYKQFVPRTKFVGRLLLLCHGLLYKEYGTQDPKAHVVVANHQNYLDAAIIAASGGGSAVASQGMANMWCLKQIMQLSRVLVVSRPVPKDASQSDKIKQALLYRDFAITPGRSIREQMQIRVNENNNYDRDNGFKNKKEAKWPKIIMFPEGTISSSDTLLQFRTSVFTLDQCIIQPYYIKYKTFMSLEWLTNSGYDAMCRSLLNPFGKVELHWLPSVQRHKNETPQEFALRVQQTICEAAGIQLTKYTNDDMFYYLGFKDISVCSQDYLNDFEKLGTIKDARKLYGKNYELKQQDIPKIVAALAKNK
ncbi:Lysophospholipid acyltransferase [Spironucleus salmonicida]|uniref:Acyltransferase n=1 Tax=Spironucleus salmonicida TaxID=348837 RepID=S5TWZ5_9EUKA|nr:acyltransferase [Spironucleus salmonicida]KAH0572500.1 Lysophospholipid acyltransferase [Spironucleus salmonicida]|eukprot:EST44536.1 Acyltransferase [Spironucleus salmonicida]